MKKHRSSKLLMIILITFCIFSPIFSKVHASDREIDTSISDIFTKADRFIKKGQSNQPISEETIKSMSQVLYNTLLMIGIIIAVIVGIIIGIKFMTGGVVEQAKVKQTLIAYVAGCVVIFGAFTIWKIVVTVLQSSPSA